jgi:2-polyprenyl-6-methoxyphenol hydroxylase-like FAD-dependent oxidoreductase
VLVDQNNNKVVKAQYVILCNGGSSVLRDQVQSMIPTFAMEGQTNIMNFINIYFSSRKLAEKINLSKNNAMVHFIFNKKIIGILVNHCVVN